MGGGDKRTSAQNDCMPEVLMVSCQCHSFKTSDLLHRSLISFSVVFQLVPVRWYLLYGPYPSNRHM